ncbi:hypothetical protein JCM10213v2_005177 [Rhodosporidiobolus nylandii]
MSVRSGYARKSATAGRINYCESSSEDSDDETVEVGATSRSGGKGSRKRGGRGKVDDEGGSSDDGEWTAKKRRKTRAKGKGKAKKQMKKADLLQTMTLDILVEVFSYLHPGELLNLSCTAKPYHNLLTSKSAEAMWRKTRGRLDLPNFDVDGFNEIRYAQLLFDRTCELCDSKHDVFPDLYFRRRFCRICRDENFISIARLPKTHPQYHPRTAEVVVHNEDTPAGRSCSGQCALRSELEFCSDKLLELENEDDADNEVRKLKVSTRTRSRGGNEPSEGRVSRVDAFVMERKGVVDHVIQRGDAVKHQRWRAIRKIEAEQKKLRRLRKRHQRLRCGLAVEEESDFTTEDDWFTVCQFRNKLRDRLQSEEDVPQFYTKRWHTSRLARGNGESLTDEVYEEIKAKALVVTQRITAEREEREKAQEVRQKQAEKVEREWQHQQARLEHLGERLSASLLEKDLFTTLTTPILPVFATFESVKPLLLPPGSSDETPTDLADEVWDDALPLIEEELSQYRLDLLLHAIKLILSATSDDPLPEDDDILEHLDEYDDAFFDRASSFLCCSFPACHANGSYEHDYSGGLYSSTYTEGRTLFTGPLAALLEHQHAAHSSELSQLKRLKKADKHTPQIFIDLPLEVACAVTALIELGDLDDATAGVEELNEKDKRGRYEWENSQIWAKRFSGWRELLDAVYRASIKTARAGPDHCLPPPSIIYHPDPVYSPSPSPSPLYPRSDVGELDFDEDGESEVKLKDD